MDLYNIRSGIQGTLQGITGSGLALASGRVALGYYPLTGKATGADWFNGLRSGASGAFASIGPGRCSRSDPADQGHRDYSVHVELWLALPAKDAVNTLQAVVAFLETIRAALEDVFIAGVTWDEPEIVTGLSFPVLHYTLEVSVLGCG